MGGKGIWAGGKGGMEICSRVMIGYYDVMPFLSFFISS